MRALKRIRIDMAVFHLFSVHSFDVPSYELPRVKLAEYYLEAESLQSAFEKLMQRAGLPEAAEVWGAPVTRLDIGPDTKLLSEVEVQQHQHWSRVQETYKLLARGPESVDRYLERRFAERYPQYA